MNGTEYLRNRAASDRVFRELRMPGATTHTAFVRHATPAMMDFYREMTARKHAVINQIMGPILLDGDGYCVTCGEHTADDVPCAPGCPHGDGLDGFTLDEAIDTALHLAEGMGQPMRREQFDGYQLWLLGRDLITQRRLHGQADQPVLARVAEHGRVEVFSMATADTVTVTWLWLTVDTDGGDPNCPVCDGDPQSPLPGCRGCDADLIALQLRA